MKAIRYIRLENGTVGINGKLDYTHADPSVNAFAKGIYKHYGVDYPKFYKMSSLSKLGFLASELLLKDVDLSGIDPELVSLIIANSSSSLHTDKIYQESIGAKPSPGVFVYTLPNILIGEICIRNGFKGEGIFFIQEEFDMAFILDYAMSQPDAAQSAMSLAGWVDIDMNGNYLAEVHLLK
ncbi:MAG: 3-oxoacyl-ACP synthase [Bacteroidota bacterium]